MCITIFDTTLRDGEQAPGASMTIPEKLHIAQQLAALGVDVIEAGFPVSSPVQFEGVQRVVKEVHGPTIAALARAVELDIREAAKALAGGAKTRIHTFIGTSDIHIEGKFADAKYGATLEDKRKTVLQKAIEAVQYAKTFTNDVEFSAEDAGRTPVAYLQEVIAAVIEAGATTINVPDTTGFCLPNEYADLIKSCMKAAKGRSDVIFSTHCHNDLGLAVANSLAGVQAGARQVECTINGIGERAGNAALEEIVMALRVRQNIFGVDSQVNSPMLMGLSKLVSTYSGFSVQPNKAIVGKNAFSHEAGIHQDGVLKRRDTYEIMRAEDVGQDTNRQISLGRHSGRHGFFSRIQTLGFSVTTDLKDDLYRRFLEIADQKKHIYDEDLVLMMKTLESDSSETYVLLEHLQVHVETGKSNLATVRIHFARTGDKKEHTATGDGPIDAIYRAIDHCMEHGYKLTGYHIRALSEGQDAVGEVDVEIEFQDRIFKGAARNMNTLLASALAYIDAINHVEAFRDSQDMVRHSIREKVEVDAQV
ncbi:MAG TPA: 2-isopropylmalate synthase [Bacteroidetes bacterium]|nr:2-isopropylmalate synthase [Bacteroidota bacterium]HRR07959.1 2-isopropylmalate synthase [Rhodothermales bacterium]